MARRDRRGFNARASTKRTLHIRGGLRSKKVLPT
jgi:hypothetical protein